ncbi:MAG: hypothetical protein ACRYFZ_09585 [Janthinobacterium lividum]
MVALNIKLTANGVKAGEFQISGSKQEQQALWECLNLIMPDPLESLKKLRPEKT